MGKEKKDRDGDIPMGDEETKKESKSVVIPVEDLSPLAHPLAQRKLVKKLHKTIKKASKHRHVKRGVKEVVKSIRKGQKGILVLAADISPIDIISHLPVLSEDASIPYIFVPSKEELGQASNTKRPTSCVLVCREGKTGTQADDEFLELYDACLSEVSNVH